MNASVSPGFGTFEIQVTVYALAFGTEWPAVGTQPQSALSPSFLPLSIKLKVAVFGALETE